MFIRFDYQPYESLLIVEKNLKKEEFLKRAGAKNGYAKTLFTLIYDAIFSESADIKEEYLKYYSYEYSSFSEYIYSEYLLERNLANKLAEIIEEDDELAIIRWSQLSYGENGIVELIFSEELEDKFTKILCPKLAERDIDLFDPENENKD